ncbi:MAG: hypothetical protein NC082_04320 [Clostridiales bacterium]|nr:hypothetical protein [Clostridiales bacterium]
MKHIDIDIYDIIPQRPPMVMVNRLLECDNTTSVTDYTITPSCIFLTDGKLMAEGIMENIAQTCAARIGYQNLIAGSKVKLGFIGAVKDFKVNAFPKKGERIVTRITVKEEIFGITLVDASVVLDDTVIATTTMKIALSEIDA